LVPTPRHGQLSEAQRFVEQRPSIGAVRQRQRLTQGVGGLIDQGPIIRQRPDP
jgi:hypothetical protein